MRYVIVVFIFCLQLMYSQKIQFKPISPAEYSSTDDYHFLDNSLKNKKMVLLGEMTHMYDDIFEMKARMVEYLHQKLGFSTIAMESSMYDLWKMNQTGFTPELFNDAIWEVWSNSNSFQRLVKYIEKNNLKVIGFDSQVNHVKSFTEELLNYLDSNQIGLLLDEDDFAIQIEEILSNVSFPEDDLNFTAFADELNRILEVIENKDLTGCDNYNWYQFIKNLQASAKDAYYNNSEIRSMDFGNKNHNFRDFQMADNLLTYSSRFPNEKIIVWADNIHVIKNMNSVKKPIIRDFIPMGSHIFKELGQDLYSMAFVHGNDSLLNKGIWYPTPLEDGSFEQVLKNINVPIMFVPSNQEMFRTPISNRLLNFREFSQSRVDELFDGYVFLSHAGSEMEKIFSEQNTDQTIPSTFFENSENKIQQRKVKVVIRDSMTNAPIPFATVILEQQKIFRVADENGEAEFEYKEDIMEGQQSITVSSLGYREKTIRLKNSNMLVRLQPSIEALQEVEVIGFRSPVSVLKMAVDNYELNYPSDSFNYRRHCDVLLNMDDTTISELEFITKEFELGYFQSKIFTNKIEQINWKEGKDYPKFKYTNHVLGGANPFRFASVLDKRKYKKFEFDFEKSLLPEHSDYYVIAFSVDRERWSYTRRNYPTQYTGKLFINRNDFAIEKIEQAWQTKLNKKEIEKYEEYLVEAAKEKESITIKQVQTTIFRRLKNNKYYMTENQYFSYYDTIDKSGQRTNRVFRSNSNFFDFIFNNVEEIPYEFRDHQVTDLRNVPFDKEFWNTFSNSPKPWE